MTWSKYEKYDKGKMLGGIYKKGRLKGQQEVMDALNVLLKVNDKQNFETIMESLRFIEADVQDIKKHLRIGIVEKVA
jgi:hypothetical protein